MKKLILAAVAALTLTSGAALAGSFNTADPVLVVPVATEAPSVLGTNWRFVGNSEYAFEAEAFETNFGVEYVNGSFSVTPYLTITDTATTDMDFDGAAILVKYGVNTNVNLYGQVSADKDWEYSETIVGVAFSF